MEGTGELFRSGRVFQRRYGGTLDTHSSLPTTLSSIARRICVHKESKIETVLYGSGDVDNYLDWFVFWLGVTNSTNLSVELGF